MSSSNGDGFAAIVVALLMLGAAAVAVYLAIALLALAAITVYVIAAFIAFFWTFVCLIAWNRPFQLGRVYVDNHDARAFVIRGAFGAVVLPLFLLAADLFLDVPIRWDWLPYFIVGGYAVFSVGFEVMVAADSEIPYIDRDPIPRHLSLPQARQELLPPPPRPARFASWDDEEARS